ncbi:hypothetical protein BDW59DRAFT_158319 [Aspergillus cavernicola]|uniref:Uncharacterized protein n=1 Tax=Aspergillus cavernicola TaxID=176166 RepID=A0ABR4IT26_9EURO
MSDLPLVTLSEFSVLEKRAKMSDPYAFEDLLDNAPQLYLGMTDLYNGLPSHWVLMLVKPGEENCIMIDVDGGYPPSTYKVRIDPDKRFDTGGIATRHRLVTTRAFDEAAFRDAAVSVPPQHCQRYVLAIVRKLEAKGMVRAGTADGFTPMLEPGIFEGPVREVSEEEYSKLERLFGWEGAQNELLVIQGKRK